MKKNLTELVFILDRSGSMCGLEDDTIGGFNGMIKKQKNGKGDVNVTTVLFDDKIELLHERLPIDEVKPMTNEDYYVRGCTALLDAVGSTINKLDKTTKKEKKKEIKKISGKKLGKEESTYEDHKVIFVIITDGLENSSREYSYKKIKKMINSKKECGWEFLFLGANIDAGMEAEKIGIARNRSVTYKNDSKGVAVNFKAVGNALLSARCAAKNEECFDENWAAPILEYNSK